MSKKQHKNWAGTCRITPFQPILCAILRLFIFLPPGFRPGNAPKIRASYHRTVVLWYAANPGGGGQGRQRWFGESAPCNFGGKARCFPCNGRGSIDLFRSCLERQGKRATPSPPRTPFRTCGVPTAGKDSEDRRRERSVRTDMGGVSADCEAVLRKRAFPEARLQQRPWSFRRLFSIRRSVRSLRIQSSR